MKGPIRFGVFPAPFIHTPTTSRGLVLGVVAALLPSIAWAAYAFGPGILPPLAISVASAMAGEAIAGALRRRFTLGDCSACLTGLLIGLSLPPGIPLWLPAAGSIFAILVVKEAFGGLGSNWMNPALAGILFCYLNWPAETSTWIAPSAFPELAGLSGSTPLGIVRGGMARGGDSPLAILAASGMSPSGLDLSVTAFLNNLVFGHLNADLPPGYIDLLVGKRAGSIGETSGILILAASVFLIARRLIRWQIPAWILGSNAFFVILFGGLGMGAGFLSGDALWSFSSGSLLLISFFMATDPVSSPKSGFGMAAYGIGIGFLVFLFRGYGSRPEGTAFAVLVMNCLVPLLERRRPSRKPLIEVAS